MPRLIVLGIALALAAGLAYLVFVRELPRTEEQASALPQQTLDLAQVVMRQQRGDTLEWIVSSDHAIYNESHRKAELRPARIQVLRSGGKNPRPVDLLGTAESAFLDEANQSVILRGSARIVKDKKLEMTSETLEYRHAAGTIKASGHVEVHDADTVIRADSAEYTISTDKLILAAPRFFE
jgi:LPS export ABC transporter protein LptC